MERSPNSVHENFLSSNSSIASLAKDTSESSFSNTMHSSTSVYDSAVENISGLTNACANNNSDLNESMIINLDGSSSPIDLSAITTDNSATINDGSLSISNTSDLSGSSSQRSERFYNKNNNTDASSLLIQSESSDTNTSQEEVDPKSQLANKAIFKTDNPNLSIIEINDDMHNENIDLENSVLVLEQPQDYEKRASSTPARRSPSTISSTASVSSSGVSSGNNLSSSTENCIEKRRKKPESLLQTSKQKLNIEIAEASANESANETCTDNLDKTVSNTSVNSNDTLQTRREIKIYDTIEEFEQNLPSTVTILNTPFGSKVYLVGTAHFSEESQDDVSYVIRNARPDVVMVELCPSRIHILKLDERTLLEEAKNINLAKIRSIIQTHGYINGIFFIMLLQMSAQTAKDLGMAPGGEFRRAFEEVQNLPGCTLHLGDRPIRVTLHRALRALSFWQTCKLVFRLLSNDTISIEEVEECKQRDLLEKLMKEMAGEFPAFSDVFVRERDMFLCHSLQLVALPRSGLNGVPRPMRVVGVVGIGHANGIAKMWGHVDPEKIPNIMEIPPASLSTRICTFTLKYSLVGLALFGAYKILRPRLTGLF